MMRIHSMTKIAVVVAALGVGSQASAAVNLVTNGSFETGDFSGWSQFGNTLYDYVSNFFDGYSPTDGRYLASFGAVIRLGGILQTGLATVAGQNYIISFNLADEYFGPSEYTASFGSTVLTDVVNAQPFGWTRLSYTATATSDSTTLSFSFRQDPKWFVLDDISVEAVPEPEEWAMLMTAIPLVGWQIRRKQVNGALA
jgi:hypothetical protein